MPNVTHGVRNYSPAINDGGISRQGGYYRSGTGRELEQSIKKSSFQTTCASDPFTSSWARMDACGKVFTYSSSYTVNTNRKPDVQVARTRTAYTYSEVGAGNNNDLYQDAQNGTTIKQHYNDGCSQEEDVYVTNVGINEHPKGLIAYRYENMIPSFITKTTLRKFIDPENNTYSSLCKKYTYKAWESGDGTKTRYIGNQARTTYVATYTTVKKNNCDRKNPDACWYTELAYRTREETTTEFRYTTTITHKTATYNLTAWAFPKVATYKEQITDGVYEDTLLVDITTTAPSLIQDLYKTVTTLTKQISKTTYLGVSTVISTKHLLIRNNFDEGYGTYNADKGFRFIHPNNYHYKIDRYGERSIALAKNVHYVKPSLLLIDPTPGEKTYSSTNNINTLYTGEVWHDENGKSLINSRRGYILNKDILYKAHQQTTNVAYRATTEDRKKISINSYNGYETVTKYIVINNLYQTTTSIRKATYTAETEKTYKNTIFSNYKADVDAYIRNAIPYTHGITSGYLEADDGRIISYPKVNSYVFKPSRNGYPDYSASGHSVTRFYNNGQQVNHVDFIASVQNTIYEDIYSNTSYRIAHSEFHSTARNIYGEYSRKTENGILPVWHHHYRIHGNNKEAEKIRIKLLKNNSIHAIIAGRNLNDASYVSFPQRVPFGVYKEEGATKTIMGLPHNLVGSYYTYKQAQHDGNILIVTNYFKDGTDGIYNVVKDNQQTGLKPISNLSVHVIVSHDQNRRVDIRSQVNYMATRIETTLHSTYNTIVHDGMSWRDASAVNVSVALTNYRYAENKERLEEEISWVNDTDKNNTTHERAFASYAGANNEIFTVFGNSHYNGVGCNVSFRPHKNYAVYETARVNETRTGHTNYGGIKIYYSELEYEPVPNKYKKYKFNEVATVIRQKPADFQDLEVFTYNDSFTRSFHEQYPVPISLDSGLTFH